MEDTKRKIELGQASLNEARRNSVKVKADKLADFRWSVVVGNIGTIQAENEQTARELYAEYAQQSREGYGRASGESVTLVRPDGEPELEFDGVGDAEGGL